MSKKEDILNTTLRLVIEKGIHNTPMSLIAEEAGVGMGTIYNYFASKEELINALYLKLKEDEAEYMLKNFKSGMAVRQSFFFFWTNIWLGTWFMALSLLLLHLPQMAGSSSNPLSSRSFSWEGDDETGAAGIVRLCLNAAPEVFDDTVTDGQTQAGTLTDLLGGKKRLEYLFPHRLGNTNTAVAYLYIHMLFIAACV